MTKFKLILAVFVFTLVSASLQAQSWQWGIRGGGSASGYDETVEAFFFA